MIYILVLSLLNGSSGGASISQIEFVGQGSFDSKVLERCEEAGKQWVKATNSFDVDARYTCLKVQ